MCLLISKDSDAKFDTDIKLNIATQPLSHSSRRKIIDLRKLLTLIKIRPELFFHLLKRIYY